MSAILRYPGGKGRFAKILAANVAASANDTLIEPFAGGGAAGLTLLKQNVITKLILVEKDPRVAAFWIKLRQDSNFARQVEDFTFASKEPHTKDIGELESRKKCLEDELERLKKSDVGMWTLVKNRCSFGGYLGGGLLVKGFGRPADAEKDSKGHRQYSYYEGVGSQWNGANLAKNIRSIHELFEANKIDFIFGDAFEQLPKYSNAFAFVDPPYTLGENAPGEGLYKENEIDHTRLFDILAERTAPWIATYNNCERVRTLVSRYPFKIGETKMNRLHADTDDTQQKDYKELVICPKHQNLILEKSMGRPKGSKNSTSDVTSVVGSVISSVETAPILSLSERRAAYDRKLVKRLHAEYQNGTYDLPEFIRLLRG